MGHAPALIFFSVEGRSMRLGEMLGGNVCADIVERRHPVPRFGTSLPAFAVLSASINIAIRS